jgi:hypothetical protein
LADKPPSTVWADHGDTVSRAYSGTGALKADYTRTGKRTKEGALHDGYKSVVRYVTNNFLDGDRQVSDSLCARGQRESGARGRRRERDGE